MVARSPTFKVTYAKAFLGVGVARFYQEIFNQSSDSVEVYSKQFEAIDGMTFRCVESPHPALHQQYR